ncbi:S1 family peptidase [Streptomyces sp. NPDC001380]|uniref:S1 family peptidase n=1 Tax=Streptomyces sp. NPDC001380 TaxID=3364566 RepID=UPI0036CBFCC7
MSHAKQRNTRRIGVLATVGGLVAAGVAVSAFADEGTGAPPAGPPAAAVGAPAQDPASLARTLVAQLGRARSAGAWIGADGRPVVAVTGPGAADAVRAAGAVPRTVARSGDQLDAAVSALRSAPRVPGTAWSVDPVSNQVVVLADRTVSAADWQRLSGTAGRLGGAVRMRRTRGALTTRIAGGDPVFTGGARCSAGFNVTDGQQGFVLTAGHCGPVGTPWAADAAGTRPIGATVKDTFPGNGDFSLIQVQGGGVDQPGAVDLGNGSLQPVTRAAEAVVGEQVTRSGSTTGVHSGRVTALDATVNYPEGTVTGLIQTDVCAEPGDSGGPLFDQDAAVGLTSGGDGDCTAGGTTFFQPVTTALQALGVQIPAGGAGAQGQGARGEAVPGQDVQGQDVQGQDVQGQAGQAGGGQARDGLRQGGAPQGQGARDQGSQDQGNQGRAGQDGGRGKDGRNVNVSVNVIGGLLGGLLGGGHR